MHVEPPCQLSQRLLTLALKTGVWFRRVRFVMLSPDPRRSAPPSGRKSTFPPVQIPQATSIDKEIVKLRGVLDHTYLNDIDGLGIPTLENISRWIWRRLQNELPGLDWVLVRRGSCGEGCAYSDRAA